ncbi:transposase [Sphingobium sp. AntQ-1]|uniref:transposase n=1 Tax=Sphingobium sp. AntQ-1 TaxID=2930091 RepID=UPI00234F23C4|nr:transposase [Sphingobium sp. AntQ-1]
MSSRIEVVSRVSGRRRWTVDQKVAVLRDAFGSDGCVRTACERHDVGSGSIYTWRRQAMSGELAGVRKLPEPAFAEVRISEPPALPAPIAPLVPGLIGIELPSGIKVTVDAAVDVDVLSRVIGALAR